MQKALKILSFLLALGVSLVCAPSIFHSCQSELAATLSFFGRNPFPFWMTAELETVLCVGQIFVFLVVCCHAVCWLLTLDPTPPSRAECVYFYYAALIGLLLSVASVCPLLNVLGEFLVPFVFLSFSCGIVFSLACTGLFLWKAAHRVPVSWHSGNLLALIGGDFLLLNLVMACCKLAHLPI